MKTAYLMINTLKETLLNELFKYISKMYTEFY